jgi:hypothetical protein
MNRMLICLVVLGGLSLGGCGATDFTEKDDTLNAMERARNERRIPEPTEMPPGLGEDLPSNAPRPLSSK